MNNPAVFPHSTHARTMFGPWADVLLLGGGSVIAMAVLGVLRPTAGVVAQLAVVAIILANFVNHPHFAYSYQIFYGSWSEAKQGTMAADLRRRWVLAGIIIPILLAGYLGVAAWFASRANYRPLTLSLLAMGLLVGWHYVKQGFGMAMVDAALKKCYWPADTRRALLSNAYACWAAAWAVASSVVVGSRHFWGITGMRLDIPPVLVTAVCMVAGVTTIWVALAVLRCGRQWRQKGLGWRQMPVAGFLAYLITLYCWLGLLSREPAFALFIPLFHSLQYLTVVARYKGNEAKQRPEVRLLPFALRGAVLGAIGFWLLPGVADFVRTGTVPRYDGTPYFFIASAWIFINVHHYFIDNVLWRQGNPKVRQFLFDSPAPQAAAMPAEQSRATA